MKWKILCGLLVASNATTAYLMLKKQPRECRAEAKDIDEKLADGWSVKTTVVQKFNTSERTYYILTRCD